jgi:hypothetical protein
MTTNIDRDRLRDLSERIQVGDTDEGADALGEIVDMVQAQHGDTSLAVRRELADMQLKAENDAALGKFAKRYPALTQEPVLVEAATHVLRDEIARDLRAAGVTDDELKPIRENVGQLASLHGKARLMRHEGVRQADKLLEDVGGVLSEKFNLKPAGTGRSPNEYVRDLRAERGFKSQDAELRDAGGSRAPGSGRPTPEPNRAADYVEKLRQAWACFRTPR